MFSVNVRELLRFFDEKPPDSAGHATALVSVLGEDLGTALLVHYLRRQHGPAEVMPDKCNTGHSKGPRLDRWVRASIDGRLLLFQVEIKNWSAHAIGGQSLALDAQPEVVRAHKVERWSREWDGQTFRKSKVGKVLEPMAKPLDLPVEPLVCFWDAMHPDGLDEPMFAVPLPGPSFQLARIFSMSAYLRLLGVETIDLELPGTERRLEWLHRVLGIGSDVVGA